MCPLMRLLYCQYLGLLVLRAMAIAKICLSCPVSLQRGKGMGRVGGRRWWVMRPGVAMNPAMPCGNQSSRLGATRKGLCTTTIKDVCLLLKSSPGLGKEAAQQEPRGPSIAGYRHQRGLSPHIRHQYSASPFACAPFVSSSHL